MRLGLLQIARGDATNIVELTGDTFDSKGRLFGRWKSCATGLRVRERMLLYSWEGTHPFMSPGDSFQGFGQYTFRDAFGAYDRADGLFTDVHARKAAMWRAVDLRRLEDAELDRVMDVMKSGTDTARAVEATRALAKFTGDGPSPVRPL
jgi:hypothetical protein